MSRPSAALVPLLACLLLSACEPKSPDRDDWRDDAYYAVSSTASDVATATLVVKQLTADRIAGNYAQVSLVAAEDDAGKQLSKISALQPQPADTGRSHRATSVMSDAGDVLTDVRIAVVRRQTASYAALLRRLEKQTVALNKVADALGGLRGKP